MLLEMNNPKPLPPVSDVTAANFENSFGNTSGSIPVPVSFIVTMASPLLFLSLSSLLSSSLLLLLLLFLPPSESISPLSFYINSHTTLFCKSNCIG
jgi:hypothetical protein